MRNVARTIMRILDGSPGAGGLKQRGQSLVELALITPLLIIMFIGIVEIGWYANHLLILMEVTRVGARNGTLASGQLSPLNWAEEPEAQNPTIHPIAYLLDNGYGVSESPSATYRATFGQSTSGWVWPGSSANALIPTTPNAAFQARDCNTRNIGFYNLIVCAMLNSLDPLELHGRAANTIDYIPKTIPLIRTSGYIKVPYPDDIVISVFALQMINNDVPSNWLDNPMTTSVVEGDPELYSITYDFKTNRNTPPQSNTDLIPGDDNYDRGFRVRVIGRYPTTANECNVRWQPTVPPSDLDNLDTVTDGPAASLSNLTLDTNQTIIERILGPLAYDSIIAGTKSVAKPSSPIPNGSFVYFNNLGDPFDYIPNKFRDQSNNRFIELAGMDDKAEIQRGYVHTGQHVVYDVDAGGNQTFCLGSEWTNSKVENLMNAQAFLKQGVTMPPGGNYNDSAWQTCCKTRYDEWQKQASYLPSQGLVLVEMFWSHTTMMDFPFMRPVVAAFGDPQRITISVWAAFPVPSIEPNIIYQLPPS
jgi:hypothetical protein